MNKTEFISELVTKTGLKRKDVETIFDASVETLTNLLANGDKLQIIGFGTFEVVGRAERSCRNPKDGTLMKIPATKVPRFKAGSVLKSAVVDSDKSSAKAPKKKSSKK